MWQRDLDSLTILANHYRDLESLCQLALTNERGDLDSRTIPANHCRDLDSGLPKVTFWAVAEAVAVDGKPSATVAEAVAKGLDFIKSLVGYQFT